MPLRVFVAGATGVVGRALLPRLRARGHHVTALVRSSERVNLEACDDVAVADLLDAGRLGDVVRDAAPDAVVHVATALREPDFSVALRRTAHLRELGTRNLVDAAVRAGAGRFVAQSMASAYSPRGQDVLDEDAPLWTDAPGEWGDTIRAVVALEQAALKCSDLEAIVLRFGAIYGPGTWYAPGGEIHQRVRGSALPLVEDGMGLTSFTHVEDAASAITEVLAGADPGVYNVVDNEPAESTEWLPAYARMIGGPDPVALTLDQARAQLDWLTVHQLTRQRGATNFRFRETVGWRPEWPSWREGFATLLDLWPG